MKSKYFGNYTEKKIGRNTYILIEGAKIIVEVGNQVKSDKVIIFHKKRRKGYRKRNGHCQQFTEITVNAAIAVNISPKNII